jgi:flagellin
MSSLLTNVSAMTALQALNQTQQSLQTTEGQISTGLAISNASDNASYWSIATKMSSDVGGLNAVQSALSESSSMVSTMSAAMTATISVMDAIKNDLVTASNPGADLSKIQTDIEAQQASLQSIGQSASFNGVNFLNTTGSTLSLVSSYDSTNGVSFINIDTTGTMLFDIPAGSSPTGSGTGILDKAGTAYPGSSVMTLNVTSATAGDIANMLTDVNTAIDSITTAASNLGADSTNIGTQQTFISSLVDSLQAGVGALVDADMNAASTKLSALQVQQQLGIQSLAIANSNTQMILKLFGG